MDEQKKAALVKAASVFTSNALFFAHRADERIERLQRAETAAEAAEECKAIFGWIAEIEKERKQADAVFMRELGRLWEFD